MLFKINVDGIMCLGKFVQEKGDNDATGPTVYMEPVE